MYTDVDVKRAVNRGEIPGARIFASTRAMAPTGMYPIVSDNWELELPHGVQPVDGVEGARLAVREQVAHGADWIKYPGRCRRLPRILPTRSTRRLSVD